LLVVEERPGNAMSGVVVLNQPNNRYLYLGGRSTVDSSLESPHKCI